MTPATVANKTLILSRAMLETHDPNGGRGSTRRRYLCPSPTCGVGKPRDSAHRSFTLNVLSGLYLCYRCGISGRLSGAVVNTPMVDPMCHVGDGKDDRAGIAAARDIWDGTISLLDERAARARMYLATRGIDAGAVHGDDIRFVTGWAAPRIGPAITFALRDRHGDLISVQGRAITPNVSAAHASRGPKRRGIYATGGALGGRVVAITEAPMDALSLKICGLAAIATCGTRIPTWLAGALRLHRQVIIATDRDEPGQAFAVRLVAALVNAGMPPERIARMRPRHKDFNQDLIADRTAVCVRVQRMIEVLK